MKVINAVSKSLCFEELKFNRFHFAIISNGGSEKQAGALVRVFLFCSKDLFNAVGNTLNQNR